MEDRDRESINITSAQVGRSVNLRQRETRYLISMAIRTACFIAAVVASGPLRWVFIAAAIFLPYIAVVFANTAIRRRYDDAESVTQEPIGEITDHTHDDQNPRA